MTNDMTSGGMTMDRFQAIIEAYGANPERWPSAERDRGEAFVANSPEAAQYVAQARLLDDMLDAAPTADASAALLGHVLDTAPRPQTRSAQVASDQRTIRNRIADVLAFLWPQTGIARPAGLLLASLMVGFFFGFSGANVSTDAESQNEDLFAYYFGSPEIDDWDLGDVQ